MTRANTTHIQLCVVVALGWLLESQPALAAEHAIPPFVAEARIVTQQFGTATNLNYSSEASIVFRYSNGWWQVEARCKYLNQTNAVVLNCMKIPDGTRSYILFEGSTNTGSISATACPNAFPSPGQAELLVPWLALCPRPDLPVIDNRRMRRFSSLPHCLPHVFNAPQNEGHYQSTYLAPENAFLSELVVTNHGFAIGLNLNKNVDDECEFFRYQPPFENGFTEMLYRLIESTNLHGIAFPIRVVCKRFTPNWGGKDLDDLRVGLQSELTVTRISFSEKDVAGRIAAPYEMFAEDARPGVRVSYFVHHDEWKPISDPEIQRRARLARQRAGSSD